MLGGGSPDERMGPKARIEEERKAARAVALSVWPCVTACGGEGGGGHRAVGPSRPEPGMLRTSRMT